MIPRIQLTYSQFDSLQAQERHFMVVLKKNNRVIELHDKRI